MMKSNELPAMAQAADELNVSTGATLVGPGRAAHGYDVVSFFSGQPVMGTDKFAVAHEGGTYRFATEANLSAFNANPDRYLPAYGGYCAFGTSVGKKFDGDPAFWKVVNDKLYFNLNGDIQATWFKDIPGNIVKADANWRRIKSAPVSSL